MQKHQQLNIQNIKKNHKNTTYMRTKIKTQVRQNHHSRYSNSSDNRNYRCRRRDKKKKYWKHKKQDHIKLCTEIMAKFLMTAYKSKVLKLRLDEDPLQRRIYYLTFMESLEAIFNSTRKILMYL